MLRRLAREPVARILGRRNFYGLDLAVTRDVLDPRSETEGLVTCALARLPPQAAVPLPLIVDLGTGSGAILAALLDACPAARGLGIDRSFAAAAVARANLDATGVGGRALVACADWATALPDGCADLLVSNPPYIESAVIGSLDPDVRDHDPRLALDGGTDGLDAYRRLAPEAARLLRPGAFALFEVGAGQAPAVMALMEAAGLAPAGTERDLGGHERIVIVRHGRA